jgi:acetate kinase
VTDAVLAELESLVPLAPLHQPHNLAPIRSLHRLRPNLIQVACFDTAFHRSMPDVAQQFALPRSFTEAGIRRYGFHGLSFEWISARLRELDPEARRVVLAHLGNGASLCAIRDGHSIATTMGFTPADGLMMGTRAGSVDSGVVFHLMRSHGLNADEVEHILNFESGLLGVSGISSDMRVLLESDRDSAKQAIALFVDRIVRELGSLAAALGGIDAVVFTGGIGEHAAPIREMVMERSAWLGLAINAAANTANAPLISVGSVRVWVLPTDEEALIADHTRRHLNMEET